MRIQKRNEKGFIRNTRWNVCKKLDGNKNGRPLVNEFRESTSKEQFEKVGKNLEKCITVIVNIFF